MPTKKGKKKKGVRIDPLMPGTSMQFQERMEELGENYPKKYFGYLLGNAVFICDSILADDLFECGFFGKGILSRSKPTWHAFEKKVLSEKLKNFEDKKRTLGFHRAIPTLFKRKGSQKSSEKNANASLNTNTEQTEKKEELMKAFSEDEQAKISEYLQLSLEEAFFLIYALDILVVFDSSNQKEIPVQKCWQIFQTIQADFIMQFVGYYHFRTFGWTPKKGLKYGVDWILYRKGPAFYHAEKAICLFLVDSQTKRFLPAYQNIKEKVTQRELSWLNLMNLNRVSEQVRKGLSLCFLHHDHSNFAKCFKNPDNCFDLFQISLLSFPRWVPNRFRNEKIKEKKQQQQKQT